MVIPQMSLTDNLNLANALTSALRGLLAMDPAMNGAMELSNGAMELVTSRSSASRVEREKERLREAGRRKLEEFRLRKAHAMLRARDDTAAPPTTAGSATIASISPGTGTMSLSPVTARSAAPAAASTVPHTLPALATASCSAPSPCTPPHSRHASMGSSHPTPAYPPGHNHGQTHGHGHLDRSLLQQLDSPFSPSHASLAVAAANLNSLCGDGEGEGGEGAGPVLWGGLRGNAAGSGGAHALLALKRHQHLLRALGGASLSRTPSGGPDHDAATSAAAAAASEAAQAAARVAAAQVEAEAVAEAGARDALVEMLLAQVETLMREKAALQRTADALAHENESLHELVGYLAEHQAEGGEQGLEEGGEGEVVTGPGSRILLTSLSGQLGTSGAQGMGKSVWVGAGEDDGREDDTAADVQMDTAARSTPGAGATRQSEVC